jgi:hypothetical protein
MHRACPVQVVLVREQGRDRGFDLALVSTDLGATPAGLVERSSAMDEFSSRQEPEFKRFALSAARAGWFRTP